MHWDLQCCPLQLSSVIQLLRMKVPNQKEPDPEMGGLGMTPYRDSSMAILILIYARPSILLLNQLAIFNPFPES